MAKNGTSIIIPIYNEEALLKRAIPQFVRWVNEQSGAYEVLLLENGSTDGSPRAVDNLARRYPDLVRAIHLPTAAIGTAVRNGVLQARQPHIVLLSADWLDADFVITAAKLLAATPVDVVLGSKGMAQSKDERPWYRRVLSWVLICVLYLLFGYRGKTVNGIQAFRASTVQPLMRQCRSSEIIESELVLRAHRAGLRIQEVPIRLKEERPARVGIIARAFKIAGELLVLRRVLGHNNVNINIHIDDAGHDAKSLVALQQLVRVDRVESVSVMAGMPATKDFAAFWHSLPAARRPALFLHANFVEGTPLTSQPAISTKNGTFAGMPRVVWASLSGRLRVADVQREFDAQVAAMHELGLPLAGLDSHMHMHALAPIAKVVDAYARKHKLMVRDFRNFKVVTLRGRFKLWLLGMVARASQARLDGRFKKPVSWRSRKQWQPFVMCSWEGVTLRNVPDNTIVACHPRIGCDIFEIE